MKILVHGDRKREEEDRWRDTSPLLLSHHHSRIHFQGERDGGKKEEGGGEIK